MYGWLALAISEIVTVKENKTNYYLIFSGFMGIIRFDLLLLRISCKSKVKLNLSPHIAMLLGLDQENSKHHTDIDN